MTANELFQAGKLAEATAAQIAKVKANPTDNRARMFLFELFLFAGDLDRARKQLEALRYDKQEQLAALAHFRETLDAEAKRRAVFAGTVDPDSLSAPPDHVKLRLAAIKAQAAGDPAKARALFTEAAAATPAVSASVNEGPAGPLADADERFGTVLEVFGSGGAYAWVPLESVASITLNPPTSPRDILWRPARILTKEGVDGDVLIAGLYPHTHLSADEELKLGRATDWNPDFADLTVGVGGRLFQTGSGPTPLVTITDITVGD